MTSSRRGLTSIATLALGGVGAVDAAGVDHPGADVALRVEQVGAVALAAVVARGVVEHGRGQVPEELARRSSRPGPRRRVTRGAGRDDRAGREREAAQAGVAHVPAVERQRVDRVVVADLDPLAVDVVGVVAVGVPVGPQPDRVALVGPDAAVVGREQALARGGRLLGQHAVADVGGVLGLRRATTARGPRRS